MTFAVGTPAIGGHLESGMPVFAFATRGAVDAAAGSSRMDNQNDR